MSISLSSFTEKRHFRAPANPEALWFLRFSGVIDRTHSHLQADVSVLLEVMLEEIDITETRYFGVMLMKTKALQPQGAEPYSFWSDSRATRVAATLSGRSSRVARELTRMPLKK